MNGTNNLIGITVYRPYFICDDLISDTILESVPTPSGIGKIKHLIKNSYNDNKDIFGYSLDKIDVTTSAKL